MQLTVTKVIILSEQAGRDPETHEVLKTKRKLEPMKVDLDPVAYKEIPDPTKVGDDMGLLSGTGKMVILIMAAIGILCVIMKLASARSASARSASEKSK